MKILSFLALIISLVGISMCLFIFYFDDKIYYEGYFYIAIFISAFIISMRSLLYDK